MTTTRRPRHFRRRTLTRIWRDFMMQASGQKGRRGAGPIRAAVEPRIFPTSGDPGGRQDARRDQAAAVISTEISGSRIDLRLPITKEGPRSCVNAAMRRTRYCA